MKSPQRAKDSYFPPRSSQTTLPLARKAIVTLGGLCVIAVLLSGIAITRYRAQDVAEAGTALSIPSAQTEAPAMPASPVKVAGLDDKADRVSPPVAANDSAKPAIAAASGPLGPAQDEAVPKAVAAEMTAPASTAPAPPLAVPAPPVAASVPPGATSDGVAAQTVSPDAAQAAIHEAASHEADRATTASIPAQSAAAQDVQVAETPADVAKLEVSTGMVQNPAPSADVPDDNKPPTEPAKDASDNRPLPPLKAARLTKSVKLHAGPAQATRAITVLPANADVKAESGCQWCTVVYHGQRGYVYKTFIRPSLKELTDEGKGLF